MYIERAAGASSGVCWSQAAEPVEGVGLLLRNLVGALDLEGDGAAVGEVEDGARGDLVGGAGLVADRELAVHLDVDLHLLVVVLVDEGLAGALLVEARGQHLVLWCVRVEAVAQPRVVPWRRDGWRGVGVVALSAWLEE